MTQKNKASPEAQSKEASLKYLQAKLNLSTEQLETLAKLRGMTLEDYLTYRLGFESGKEISSNGQSNTTESRSTLSTLTSLTVSITTGLSKAAQLISGLTRIVRIFTKR